MRPGSVVSKRCVFYRYLRARRMQPQCGLLTGTPACSTDIAISYSMSEEFLIQSTGTYPGYGTGVLWSNSSSGNNPNLPNTYSPKLASVKNSSVKICIADGSRYVDCTSTAAPDYSLSPTGSGGGSWADAGSWTISSHAWPRGYPGCYMNEGYATAPVIDWRPITYRHGRATPGGAPGKYYFNAAFFDGHVETMDDLASSNPSYWIPSGAILVPGGAGFGSISTSTSQATGYVNGMTYTIP